MDFGLVFPGERGSMCDAMEMWMWTGGEGNGSLCACVRVNKKCYQSHFSIRYFFTAIRGVELQVTEKLS